MKIEMIKLNRLKYAYSEEEKEALLKEGYTVVPVQMTGEQEKEKEEKLQAEPENDAQPDVQAELQPAADNEPAEKKGTKKK